MSTELLNYKPQSKQRQRAVGEVFTPLELVDEILSKLPDEVWEPTRTFLDPASGDGNFLVRVIDWKIEKGSTIQQAFETTYGVELMQDNVDRCKERLLELADAYDKSIHGMKAAKEKYSHIIDKNIVCANSLEYDFSFGDVDTKEPILSNTVELLKKYSSQEECINDLLGNL